MRHLHKEQIQTKALDISNSDAQVLIVRHRIAAV